MKRIAWTAAVAALAAGCLNMEQVKYDFGLGERPEGYVSGSELAAQKLDAIGETELQTLNFESRHGEIKVQESEGRQASYYKTVKRYENYVPLGAETTSRSAMGGHKYTGRIKYEYRVLQSEPFPTRTEAEAASATIPTGETGSEIYVYRLDAAGGWADNERRTSGR